MKRKIYWNMCLMALLSILLTAVLTTVVYYNDLEAQMRQEVITEVKYLEAGLQKSGTSYLEEIAAHVRSTSKNRITWIDADGIVLYDDLGDEEEMENHKERPEVQEALEHGVGTVTRFSDTLSEKTYYYAVLLPDGTVLRMANTTESVLSGIFDMIPMLVVLAVLVMGGGMILAKRQTAGIVDPINQLDLDHPAEAKIYDELAPLMGRVERQQNTIRQQMEMLKSKQKEFTAITENMSEGFIVIGKMGEVESYNTSALRILGVAETEESRNAAAEGRGSVNILSFNRSHIFREAVDQALAGCHNTQNMELNGRVYQVIANPVQEAEGVTGAIIVILDITEKEEREDLRREFTANVSHELKTPLTSISGYAEIMKNGLVKAEDIPRFSEKIYTEAQRMIRLIGDIIRLSQLDENKVEIEKTNVDLYAVAQNVVEQLKAHAANHQVELRLLGSSQTVFGNSRILEEMISNLCDNGIKYHGMKYR